MNISEYSVHYWFTTTKDAHKYDMIFTSFPVSGVKITEVKYADPRTIRQILLFTNYF